MKAHRLSAIALAALLQPLAGCSDTLSIESLSGVYELTRAESSSLPATVQSSDTLVIEVIGGELQLDANAQYLLTVDFRLSDPRVTGSSTQRFIDVGPWEINGGLVLLDSTTPDRRWAGSVNGSSIDLALGEPLFLENPVVLTFRRTAG